MGVSVSSRDVSVSSRERNRKGGLDMYNDEMVCAEMRPWHEYYLIIMRGER